MTRRRLGIRALISTIWGPCFPDNRARSRSGREYKKAKIDKRIGFLLKAVMARTVVAVRRAKIRDDVVSVGFL